MSVNRNPDDLAAMKQKLRDIAATGTGKDVVDALEANFQEFGWKAVARAACGRDPETGRKEDS